MQPRVMIQSYTGGGATPRYLKAAAFLRIAVQPARHNARCHLCSVWGYLIWGYYAWRTCYYKRGSGDRVQGAKDTLRPAHIQEGRIRICHLRWLGTRSRKPKLRPLSKA